MYTIGFDFKDPLLYVDRFAFSIRIFTERNAYTPDPDKVISLTKNGTYLLKADGLAGGGNQFKVPGSVELMISRGKNDRFIIEAKGKHASEIIKSVLIQVHHLNVETIEYDHQLVESVNERRDITSLKYPKQMKMPLAFIEDRQGDNWFALSKDNRLRAKAFATHYDPYTETQVLDLAHEEDQRDQNNHFHLPPWHLGLVPSKQQLIDERCHDLEKHFGLVPYEKRKDTPKWLDDIKLVTILHGEHWTGHVFNTFNDMEEAINIIAEHIDGKQVLLFLPGWDGRYYYNYPEYKPAESMGGKKGLKSLVDKAHAFGMKVVPMLGSNNANKEVLQNLGMPDVALKDRWGHEQRCDWVDWDYDLFVENNCVLANIGQPDFQNYMIQTSQNLIDTYQFDGIFLDITIWWDNDPNYSPYEGLVSWANALKTANPDLLIFGENSYDALWGVFSIFHEKDHPAGHGFSLYRYAKQTYYLAHPAPGMGSGGIHEFAWKETGEPWEREVKELIPTLSVVGDTFEKYKKAAITQIERAKSWEPSIPKNNE